MLCSRSHQLQSPYTQVLQATADSLSFACHTAATELRCAVHKVAMNKHPEASVVQATAMSRAVGPEACSHHRSIFVQCIRRMQRQRQLRVRSCGGWEGHARLACHGTGDLLRPTARHIGPIRLPSWQCWSWSSDPACALRISLQLGVNVCWLWVSSDSPLCSPQLLSARIHYTAGGELTLHS